MHRYTFGMALPQDYDRKATHTIAAYATREDDAHVANVVFSFVPAGGAPQLMREVVSTAACNGCHDPLEAHGGSRREVGLCIICHTDQTIDPETGNTVDFAVMVHKIHAGENLTQLPYYIVGHALHITRAPRAGPSALPSGSGRGGSPAARGSGHLP